MIENQLATITYSIIHTKFSDAEYFYCQLKTNINSKPKALSQEQLTENELYYKGVDIANNIIAYFVNITIHKIEIRISKEIVQKVKI